MAATMAATWARTSAAPWARRRAEATVAPWARRRVPASARASAAPWASGWPRAPAWARAWAKPWVKPWAKPWAPASEGLLAQVVAALSDLAPGPTSGELLAQAVAILLDLALKKLCQSHTDTCVSDLQYSHYMPSPPWLSMVSILASLGCSRCKQQCHYTP